MDEKLFSKKIRYLYDRLDKKGKDFTKLFWDGDKKKFASRHTTVHKSWLGKGIQQVKGFYFDDYEISTYMIGDEVAFSQRNFMDDSFEEFKGQVDRYIAYHNRVEVWIEYKYIYHYFKQKELIVYSKLKVIKKEDTNRYRVKLIVLDSDKRIPPYQGILEINQERYYISVENSIEVLTFYFVLGRGYADNSKVYGIGLGISQEGGLVEANKSLLTQKILSPEEEEVFYLHVNEMEYLLSDEVLDIEKNKLLSKKELYQNKLQDKLNNLSLFSKKIHHKLKDELEDDIYWNIFQQSLIGINEISKKIHGNHNYFIHRRRMATEIFLRTINNGQQKSCRIVYPLITTDTTLFDEKDERSQRILNLHITLLKKGIKIERIFIIDKDFRPTDYFKKTIEKLMESGMVVKMAFIEDIDILGISSYDFVYGQNIDVAIYRNIRDRICFFKVTKVKERVRQLSYDFKKIEKVSYDYHNFFLDKYFVADKILEQLVGEWHNYTYGSLIINRNEFRLWHSVL